MNSNNRPLSPHLQVYRLPLSAILSIMHRMTGVFLSLGTLLLVWWLISVSQGEAEFTAANEIMNTLLAKLILFGWSYALFFHLSNGIRHLFWDIGRGFEIDTVAKSSLAVITSSIVLTVLVWATAYLG